MGYYFIHLCHACILSFANDFVPLIVLYLHFAQNFFFCIIVLKADCKEYVAVNKC